MGFAGLVHKVRHNAYLDVHFGSSNLLETEGTERCPSGLRSTLGKRVLGKLNRGFESHPLRQLLYFLVFTSSRAYHGVWFRS